jgi:D-3-phosphoglycerate dehydrogenase
VLEHFAPRLKVISKWGTGVDSIDLSAADALGIKVFNTPDAFTDAVADSVMGYVLSFARALPWMDAAMKRGDWEKRTGFSLRERTLGVIGVGRIGKAVLTRARAFGMQLLGNDIVEVDRGFVSSIGVSMGSLQGVLTGSDYVSINCDLNPSSRGLIDADRLNLMKEGSVLINTARGPIVVESALIEALDSGRLAGAALDVFEEEPLPPESPLRRMENVLLAPHNSNSSPSAWERVHLNSLANLFRGLGLDVPEGVLLGTSDLSTGI